MSFITIFVEIDFKLWLLLWYEEITKRLVELVTFCRVGLFPYLRLD